jgi:hypothetical protein
VNHPVIPNVLDFARATLAVSRAHKVNQGPGFRVGLIPDPWDAYALGLAPCVPCLGGNGAQEVFGGGCPHPACGSEGCNCHAGPREPVYADVVKADLEQAVEQLLGLVSR